MHQWRLNVSWAGGVLTEDMRKEVAQESSDVGRIRVPSDLNASLDRFFSDLKLRILDKAVRCASSRTGANNIGTLRKEDLVATAHEALAGAATELHNALSPCESTHVRRASGVQPQLSGRE